MELVKEIAIENVQIIAAVAVPGHVRVAVMEVAKPHVNTPVQIVVKTISNSNY